jgi:hypothetical protein
MFVPFAEMKVAPFKSYEDIPPLTKEYVIYVADAKTVEEIPLDDINGFMLMLCEAEAKKREEWEDGWVL